MSMDSSKFTFCAITNFGSWHIKSIKRIVHPTAMLEDWMQVTLFSSSYCITKAYPINTEKGSHYLRILCNIFYVKIELFYDLQYFRLWKLWWWVNTCTLSWLFVDLYLPESIIKISKYSHHYFWGYSRTIYTQNPIKFFRIRYFGKRYLCSLTCT